MKTILFFLCVASLAFTATANPADLIIRNVTIVSPEQVSIATKQDVVIDQGRITQIGNSLTVSAQRTIDGTSLFLAPGLIDSHTHLGGVPGMTYPQMQANLDIVNAASAQIPRSYLYHGFTTVIDLHADANEIKGWNRLDQRPTAYFCGGAPLVDGYPMSFVPKPIRYKITPYFLLDGGEAPDGINPENHTPQAVVKRIKEDGAICVKTHYESGFGRKRDLPTPSVKLISELKEAAHAAGLPVLLHANSEAAQRFGVSAGVDAFAHGMWTWSDRNATELNSEIRTILDQAIEKGIALQPTVQVLYGERDLHDPDYLQKPAIQRVLPESLLKWYSGDAGQQFRRQMASIPYVKKMLSDDGWQAIDAVPIKRVTEVLEYWAKHNGKLLFGSDTPSDMTYANPPGLNGRYEMQRWQQAGVSPQQFLRAATIENAEFFGLEREIGTIETGKQADLLLLSENPQQSFEAYDSIKWVISRGVAIDRADLSAQPD